MSYTPVFHDKKGRTFSPPEPLAPLADTHGHLTSFRTLTPTAALAQAELAGVRLLAVPLDPSEDALDVPATLNMLEEAISAAAQEVDTTLEREGEKLCHWDAYPEVGRLAERVYILAGVHPYGARRYLEDPSVERRLHELLKSPRCRGVGEFGLDLGPYNEIPLAEQIPAFKRQLILAHELNLPCELHIRNPQQEGNSTAHEAALKVLREVGVPQAGCVLHCYTEGPELIDPFAELGCFFAFGGALTFARSEAIRVAATLVPESQLLTETDSPYMCPVPLRGSECQSAYISFTAAELARIRAGNPHNEATSPANKPALLPTYQALWENAKKLFAHTV